MSSQSAVYLSLIILVSANVNHGDFCGKRLIFNEPKGIIETNDKSKSFENCTWLIKTPKSSIVFIKIEHLQLGSGMDMLNNERNCLLINSIDNKRNFLSLCSETINFNTLSLPTNELIISLEITSDSYLELIYTSYLVNCTYDKLSCMTSRFLSRTPDEACLRGMLTCHSSCTTEGAACGDICYDVFLQRCDGIMHCPHAEDEVGCNPTLCPNQIQCSNDTRCVQPSQICDKKVDCKNGFDESSCQIAFCEGRGANCYIEKKLATEFSKDDSTYVVIIILGILAIVFLCTIFRCLTSRQNVRSLLNRPLEIPLPPFRGPGESSSTLEGHPFTDDDFKPGGEIYEGFTQNILKIKSRRKNMLEIEDGGITFVKPPPGQEVIEKYFKGVQPVLSEEMAALATLKISRDRCYGLRKTRSEERAMTKLLFIDNVDNYVSGDSDTDSNEDGSNWRSLRKKVYPKSDTDYVRRKRVEINIV